MAAAALTAGWGTEERGAGGGGLAQPWRRGARLPGRPGPPGGSRGKGSAGRHRAAAEAAPGQPERTRDPARSGEAFRSSARRLPVRERPRSCVGGSFAGKGVTSRGAGKIQAFFSSPDSHLAAPALELKCNRLPLAPPQVGLEKLPGTVYPRGTLLPCRTVEWLGFPEHLRPSRDSPWEPY